MKLHYIPAAILILGMVGYSLTSVHKQMPPRASGGVYGWGLPLCIATLLLAGAWVGYIAGNGDVK